MRAGANAVANACFQRALNCTTPVIRRLDPPSLKSLSVSDLSRDNELSSQARSEIVNHISFVAINDIPVR